MRAFYLAVLPAVVAALATPSLAAQDLTPAPKTVRDSLKVALDSLGVDVTGVNIVLDKLTVGDRQVGAGEVVGEDLTVLRGNLDVHGTVEGNAVAIRGNVTIHEGARVHGDVIALGGATLVKGGTVDGEIRSVSGSLSAVRTASYIALTPGQLMRRAASLATGVFAVLAVIGIGILVLMREKLAIVADTAREGLVRSFLAGVAGEILALPSLTLVIVLLAITILGIVIIPFAVLAFGLLLAGALALGFLASAYIGGRAIGWSRSADRPVRMSRTHDLVYLMVGLAVYYAMWLMVSAIFGLGSGAVAQGVEVAAIVITWVAVTVGFGATLLSRGGARRADREAHAPSTVSDEYSWQTPTPVSGVAAARRPTPAPRPREL